ncbi:tetratricopeptide repeat protein [Roseibium polysiphoniae]|uniref:Tetratricopeptide repeat protein n=1 Tax=Roseibium polysiphoniae TaxID=2571221 RepID=A0ABR9C9R7_9HYPH|nr:tetratricopeptide repeat protein [Roseibium polysiphoniae]MBD8876659.1 hypothetical protein [Roseibium polysiphoniae]
MVAVSRHGLIALYGRVNELNGRSMFEVLISYSRRWHMRLSRFRREAKKAESRKYNTLAKKYSHMNMWQECIKNCDLALNINKKQPETLRIKGAGLIELGRFLAAETNFRGLIRQYPDLAQGYNGLAAVYLRQERYDECVAACNESIQRFPPNTKVVFTKGKALLELGRANEAEAFISDFLRENGYMVENRITDKLLQAHLPLEIAMLRIIWQAQLKQQKFETAAETQYDVMRISERAALIGLFGGIGSLVVPFDNSIMGVST